MSTATIVPASLLTLSLVGYVFLLNDFVPEPYMDEPFHVPQARLLCETGSLLPYDPKLTTPPGLYLLSYCLLSPLRLSGLLDTATVCGTTFLRATNALLALALYFVVHDILRLYDRPPRASAWTAWAIVCFPTLFFFHGIYYTDTGAALFVLAAHAAALRGSYISSGLMSLIAILFRQTNIIWVLLVAVDALVRRISPEGCTTASAAFLDIPTGKLRYSETLRGISILIRTAVLEKPLKTLKVLTPYAVVGALFAYFLYWNGGIVLGDKGNHVAGIHLPQLLYFAAFLCFALLPATLQPSSFTQHLRWMRGRPDQYLVILALVLLAIYHSTLAHPFILSDNRHYTFYLWSRILSRPILRYALAPAYTFAIWHCARQLGARANYVWCISFVLCTAAVLIPSPLIEPRYFTIPYLFARLRVDPRYRRSTSPLRIILEILLWASINTATIFLFFTHPFTWPGHLGLQRFMW